MKKFILCSLLCLPAIIGASNLCLGTKKGPWLLRKKLEKVSCDCNCWEQPKVKIDHGKGYGCVACGHRQIPEKVFKSSSTKKQPKTFSPKKYKRYVEIK